MAIRRDTFTQLRIPAWWTGAVSDDYRLSEAVRAAGLHIVFTPGALVAATDSTTSTELLSWTTRQMRITRFYAPRLWHLSLVAHLIYCGAMVAGVSLLLLEGSRMMAVAALAVQLGIGYYKAARRLTLASDAMPAHRQWFARYRWLHALLTPCGTWLWLYASMAAALSDTIQWRGYALRLSRLRPPPAAPEPPPVPVSPAKPFPPPADPAVDPG
jgi:cellulose synthase/poly-beta-1,6-N-acetylglucosamine synthase-like glycosyltransferase